MTATQRYHGHTTLLLLLLLLHTPIDAAAAPHKPQQPTAHLEKIDGRHHTRVRAAAEAQHGASSFLDHGSSFLDHRFTVRCIVAAQARKQNKVTKATMG